jgi:hypothetical protein
MGRGRNDRPFNENSGLPLPEQPQADDLGVTFEFIE